MYVCTGVHVCVSVRACVFSVPKHMVCLKSAEVHSAVLGLHTQMVHSVTQSHLHAYKLCSMLAPKAETLLQNLSPCSYCIFLC